MLTSFKRQIKNDILKVIFAPKKTTNSRFQHLLSNFPYSFPEFCEEYCFIQPKTGGTIPFVLNQSQKLFFDFLVKNYEKNNKQFIDFLVIKFRQNGISTLSVALFFYSSLANKFNCAFTAANAVNKGNLFKMLERFYSLGNFADLGFNQTERHKGERLSINDNTIIFLNADGNTTRSLTIQALLEDELGERNDDVDNEALADVKNRMRIGLGTPKGIGNRLHLAYKNTEVEDILFLAWHKMPENRVERDVKISPEIEEYLNKYEIGNIDIRYKRFIQLKFNDAKKNNFDPITKLNQEYPPNINIGFEATADNCFCDPYFINLAFQNKNAIHSNQAIIGIDVAGGGDKTIMAIRCGDICNFMELKHNPHNYFDYNSKAIQIVNFMMKNPNFTFTSINVDSTGAGQEFVNILKNTLIQSNLRINVNAVHFGTRVERKITAFESKKIGVKEYMYFELRTWLTKANVALQDILVLKEELLATKIVSRNGEEFLLKKEEIKKQLGHSPDYADALALTFASRRDVRVSFEGYEAVGI